MTAWEWALMPVNGVGEAVMTLAQTSARVPPQPVKPMNPEEALEFILYLANRDYGDLTEPGKLDTLIFRLQRWLQKARSIFMPDETPGAEQLEDAYLGPIRDRVTTLVDKRHYETVKFDQIVKVSLPPGERLSWVTLMDRPGLIDWRLFITLQNGPVERLQRCARASCRRIYLARKGQQHCTLKCSNAEQARRYREKQAAAKAEALARAKTPEPSAAESPMPRARQVRRARPAKQPRARGAPTRS